MTCDCGHEAEEYFISNGRTICARCQEILDRADAAGRELPTEIEILNKGDNA